MQLKELLCDVGAEILGCRSCFVVTCCCGMEHVHDECLAIVRCVQVTLRYTCTGTVEHAARSQEVWVGTP